MLVIKRRNNGFLFLFQAWKHDQQTRIKEGHKSFIFSGFRNLLNPAIYGPEISNTRILKTLLC